MPTENQQPEKISTSDAGLEERASLTILLEGKLSALCEMDPRFLPQHVTFLNDPEVSRYLRTRPPVTLEHQTQWLAQAAQDPTKKIFGVFAKEAGKMRFVGVSSFGDIDPVSGGARSGTIIGNKNFWNKGIATESRILQLHYGFSKLGLKFALGHAVGPNVASQRALERIGYHLLEKRPQARTVDNVSYDEYVYKITREDFNIKWGAQFPDKD